VETAPRPTAPWSTAQAYVIAICCLLLGATVGYLLRSSAFAPAPAAAVATHEAHPSATQGSQPPTPDQMRHMADKQVEPLLAKLKTNGNDPGLLAQIAASYFAAHQFADAATYYERLVAVQPSAKNLVSLGNALYYSEQPDKALAIFDRALALEPGSADALFNVGVIKWQSQNDPKGAIAAWQKLLKLNPDHPHRAQVEEMIARAKQHIGRTPPASSGKPAS
jgi:cytochrome c-type biogenesis protein CcmH/NrfG